MVKEGLKIYFAGSIRGGRDYVPIYHKVINSLNSYGQVLTEHIGDKKLSSYGESNITDEEIYTRDMEWLRSVDLVVADVSIHSTGVGYEIGQAESMGKKILCLYHRDAPQKISGMINGNKNLNVKKYKNIDEVEKILEEFFSEYN